MRQAAGITHKTGYITQWKLGGNVCPIGRHAHIPPTSPGANAARALPVSGRLRPEFVCLIRLVRPSITPTLNHCHIIASSSILARCVLLLYWRVGLALAIGVWGWPLLGWEKTAVIGWSGRRGVKARASSRGGALGVGGGLARPAKPEPTNVIPLIPTEVRARAWSSVKSAVSSWRHRSLTGVGGG